MFNDSTAVERVRRGGSHSSNTAKLVNMDVWYATTLWLALLSGWIDPSSGRRTRKNPTGGILMKPIMPPALLTPQQLDDSYYYDQGIPPFPPHPAIPATYPYQSSAFDSSPQHPSPRLWRSIDDPSMPSRPAKSIAGQFSSAFSQQVRSPFNPTQRFPPNSPFHPGMRNIGQQNKPTLSRIDLDRRDPFNDDGPFSNNNQFGNRNPFNLEPSFNKRTAPFDSNPFSKPDPLSQNGPFNELEATEFEWGPTHEWSGRSRRQPPKFPSPPSMENSWEPMLRYGSMQRQSPSLGRLDDRQASNMNTFDNSDSQSEEQSTVPRQRKGLQAPQRRMIRPQGINYPYPGPMNSQRQHQRPLPPMQQYGLDSQHDFFGNRNSPKAIPRHGNKPTRSRMANLEAIGGSGEENSGGGQIVKLPFADKQLKSKDVDQAQEDEFMVESEEHSNPTTGKPSETNKDTKSSEGSDESKNVDDSGSTEESTTKKSSHKSKSGHEHKHKEAVAVALATETDENVTKHVHGHSHHGGSKPKAKSNESLSSESQHGGLPKKRRPRTTLATDFNVEDKKEVVGEPVAVAEAKKI